MLRMNPERRAGNDLADGAVEAAGDDADLADLMVDNSRAVNSLLDESPVKRSVRARNSTIDGLFVLDATPGPRDRVLRRVKGCVSPSGGSAAHENSCRLKP